MTYSRIILLSILSLAAITWRALATPQPPPTYHVYSIELPNSLGSRCGGVRIVREIKTDEPNALFYLTMVYGKGSRYWIVMRANKRELWRTENAKRIASKDPDSGGYYDRFAVAVPTSLLPPREGVQIDLYAITPGEEPNRIGAYGVRFMPEPAPEEIADDGVVRSGGGCH